MHGKVPRFDIRFGGFLRLGVLFSGVPRIRSGSILGSPYFWEASIGDFELRGWSHCGLLRPRRRRVWYSACSKRRPVHRPAWFRSKVGALSAAQEAIPANPQIYRANRV